jgi:hypothetical protein
VIQISAIALLLIIYIFYEFELLQKIRRNDVIKKINPLTYLSVAVNKDLKEIEHLIKKAETEINSEKLKDAEDTYHDLIKIYNDKLGSDLRKKVIDKISLVYNHLLVHRILKSSKDIEASISKKDKASAKEFYNKMQEYYIQLPKQWKSKVSDECKKSFELLTKN